jgi:hypothetical protein
MKKRTSKAVTVLKPLPTESATQVMARAIELVKSTPRAKTVVRNLAVHEWPQDIQEMFKEMVATVRQSAGLTKAKATSAAVTYLIMWAAKPAGNNHAEKATS